MPSLLGGLLSVLIAGVATKAEYDQFNSRPAPEDGSLAEIFPLELESTAEWKWTPGYQVNTLNTDLWLVAGHNTDL